MLFPFLHLVWQSLLYFPKILSTNWLSIVLPLLIYVGIAIPKVKKDGWAGIQWRNIKKETWLLLYAYALLFGWAIVHTIYRDHEKLQADNKRLFEKVIKLSIQSPYEKSFIGSFAFTNTIGAFAYLTRSSEYQPSAKSICQIKITNTPDNRAVASSLHAIASDMGCNVSSMPYDPDEDPETWREVKQSLPHFIVIHALKKNKSADGFITGMSNTFHVQRAYDLPPGSPPNLIWLQIGSGPIWRLGR